MFPGIKIGKGQRIDPGLDPTLAVPLRDACEHFPGHQFVIANVSGRRVIDEKDMTCPYQEINLTDVPVDRKAAILGQPQALERLVRAGKVAALDQLDFPALGGKPPRRRVDAAASSPNPVSETATSCRIIRSAVFQWQLSRNEYGECPTISELIADGKLERGTWEDAWGGEFVLTCTEDEVVVSSSGADRKQGTADDVRVPR